MDWPYDDDTEAPAEPAPSWDCPDDTCACHATSAAEDEYEFSVMLLSPEGERMPGAICRMRYQGRVINEPQPRADGAGWVTAKIPRVPSTVLIEWAPEDAPRTPGYPFRRRHYVELSETKHEAGRRRMHNLGHSVKHSLADNIRSFQRAYGYEEVTGTLSDIEDDLVVFHDQGRAPVSQRERESPDGPALPQGFPKGLPEPKGRDGLALRGDSSKAKLGPDDKDAGPSPGGGDAEAKPQKLPPQAPPPPPPTLGAKSVGQGTVQPLRALPSILTAIADADAKKDPASTPGATPGLFELVALYAEWNDPADPTNTDKSVYGWFWIFADALMWEVPNDALWSGWAGTSVEQPLPRKPWRGVKIRDRKRLVRLPCTGKEAQAAADTLTFTQAELLAFQGADMTSPDANDTKVKSILPTAELYNLSFLRADAKIHFQQVAITNNLVDNVLTYAERVAKAFDAAAKGLSSPPSSLGTPGKIWAIADRMDTWVWCNFFCGWAFACINHGFHQRISWDAKGKPQSNPFQDKGGCHDWDHTDYSQIFSAVGGWCWVKGQNETGATWRKTESVYTDPILSHLVRDNGPVPALRYVGNIGNKPHPKDPPSIISKECIEKLKKKAGGSTT
jgi:hypothetical protein